MTDSRRPLKSRGAGWARALAAGLARTGVRPDVISASSVVFALAGAAAFWLSADAGGWCRPALLIAAALCIQLRLLANLLDGMVAVEHGRGGPLGPVWNELPDRIADALFLVGAGYALRHLSPDPGPLLGWLAAVLAVLTAYIRELGRALGFEADFAGPGAKPHRMAALTAGCLLAAAEPLWRGGPPMLLLTLALIVVLTAVTVVRRTLRLAARLRAAPV
ncbi:CDP-alcohol phosphatidyltransferase family protein [Brevundimonas sp.]|uniref:CDP-alcohol phosphatidyltransferase family protein n=1 Tax=Brevundimonas sp. TaxID=1871086 RepID=UPI002D54FE6C|nr:CDP-alcohol phosphatidyltransferase family protein [Brevundimonas sp.]HYD26122.1 CDP-alcohol phosphatidyltransferase family protein [Brevundimonas sp.]